jgi:hypothetical protein
LERILQLVGYMVDGAWVVDGGKWEVGG